MEVNDAVSCVCTSCGVVCRGRFPGCQAVWSSGRTELPTTHERHLEFMALPYVGVQRADEPLSQPGEAGTEPESPSPEGPHVDEPVRLDAALALQEAVNTELLEAIRRLERTVAELTAASPGPSPLHRDGQRRSVEVLQWVEPGRNGTSALPRTPSTAGTRRRRRRRR